MKMFTKVFLGFALSFMCIFASIGYAALSDELVIEGTTDAAPPDAIFITEILNVRANNATINEGPTNITAPSTKFLTDITFKGSNSWVTFDLVVLNGTSVNQYFDTVFEYDQIEGLPDHFVYTSVKSQASVLQGTPIAPGEIKTFTVTLAFTGSGTQTRRMLHELDFVLDSNDLTQAVSKGVTDIFKDILNNALESDVSYTYGGQNITVSKDSTYDALKEKMEWDFSGSYIGNLDGADGDDKALVNALFGDTLKFTVGGQEVPVTVMAKEKNVYGSNTKEMVLYITADDLTAASTYVPVYAAVFTKDASGQWVQIGETFAGEARTNSYSGWAGSGSFNTERWRSTQVYNGAAVGSDISTVISKY